LIRKTWLDFDHFARFDPEMAIIPTKTPWIEAFTKGKNTPDTVLSIYLPSKTSAGVDLWISEQSNLAEATMNFMLQELGGATMIKGIGFFKGEGDVVHMEESTICRSICTAETLQKKLEDIYYLANSLAVKFNQESIAVEINSELYFIGPTPEYRRRFKDHFEKAWVAGDREPLGYHKYINMRLPMVGSTKE
jgi:hypothetical protein